MIIKMLLYNQAVEAYFSETLILQLELEVVGCYAGVVGHKT